MSHFTVAVLTKTGAEDEVHALMAPYHEFECTGRDDEFVKDIDKLDQYRKEYDAQTGKFLVNAETPERVSAYDDRFYRLPTPEELEKHKPMCGSGCGGGISWISKDWGDGRGYKPRVHFTPEGWTEIEVPISETTSFADFLEDWYNLKGVREGQPETETLGMNELTLDLQETHKYGYYMYTLDENGNKVVTKAIDRTNPDAFWDWYVIGGRWNNYHFINNRCMVSKFPPLPETHDIKNRFFAVITPDGKYHSKGKGGWWGTSSDDKDNWPEIEAELFAANPDSIAVVVDFHI
jgi:hypothetical protein